MNNEQQSLWQRLGWRVVSWADSIALAGVGQLAVDLYQITKSADWKFPPLNWHFPFQEFYTEQEDILWVHGPNDERVYVPQNVLFTSSEEFHEEKIALTLLPNDFLPPMPVTKALDYYRLNADGSIKKHFFDGENARLVDWNSQDKVLTFQGSSYFQYLQTNLALDYPLPAFGSLRHHLNSNRRVENLSESRLANATGINALIFSADGYMIFQKRSDTVLIRPNELCSGFSGTVDRIDIHNAVKQEKKLSSLDIPREMVEELGLQRREITQRQFLGITRELIRGGAPEMFYAVDVAASANNILSRIPQDKEGHIKAIFLGAYASSTLSQQAASRLPQHFWSMVEAIQTEGSGPISIPLLTNLVLWYRHACPKNVGASRLASQ